VIIFETPRLIVRQYTLEDSDEFFALNSDKEVMRFIRPPKTREDCDSFLQQNVDFYGTHPDLGRWATIEKETKTFIGSLALIPIKEEDDRIQIGYALKPSQWGKGFATELVKAGIPFFFHSRQHQFLYAITEQPNTGSQKVLVKCGFKQDGFFMENKKKLLMFKLERNI
jgi:ribosomal-protein-alanine N-acetyltransferase